MPLNDNTAKEEKERKKTGGETSNRDKPSLKTTAEENKTINEQPNCELSTKEAYFASLNEWVKQANISQNAMAFFPYYLLSMYPQIFKNQNPIASALPSDATRSNASAQQAPVSTNRVATAAANDGAENDADRRTSLLILNEQMQAQIINRNGGYEHVVAPFWKRGLAELVDAFILFAMKLAITFAVVHIFDLDLDIPFDRDVFKKSLEDEYAILLALSADFLHFSPDLFILEVLTRLLVCIYEAFWTRLYGATPGKMLLGIKIVYVEAMIPLQPPHPLQVGMFNERAQIKALVFPAELPTTKRALARAVAKNMLMSLLFPMCVIMLFFKNNRTAYDIMTKTVVIEDNPNAVLRRRD